MSHECPREDVYGDVGEREVSAEIERLPQGAVRRVCAAAILRVCVTAIRSVSASSGRNRRSSLVEIRAEPGRRGDAIEIAPIDGL
jgi:hypothetical protein